MDPLGVTAPIVDALSLPRWSTTPVPSYEIMPSNSRRTENPFPVRQDLNSKVALWSGDITKLNTIAIVNTTNESLSSKGVLSERIHRASGPELLHECRSQLLGCRTGEAKISKGYSLPARYVIHTVGPRYNIKYKTAAESALFSFYRSVMKIVREYRLASVGLCVVNTSRRGYPPEDGAHIALRTVRRFLEKFSDIDLVVFGEENADELLFSGYKLMRKMKTVKLSSLKLRSTHLIHARDPIAYGTLLKFKPQHLFLREPLKWRVLHTPVVAVDMAVTNPTRERIVMVMDVLIICEPKFILHPRQQVTYHVTFSPTVIGEHTGRYELVFQDAESQSRLERSLGVSLLRKMKNQVSGVVILVFNFVFSPVKPFRHTLPFEAFFAPSSDPNFTVTPAYGELPPSGTEGTLIKVAYKPQIYGKTHRAKRVVQISDMQWMYDILGTTADYNPPNVQARITSTSANSARRTVKQKKNYVLKN